MVQKTTAGPKGRGRPPKFDREAVIDAAIGAFWDDGLEGTSLPALEAATGVDRSTLYNSFGGKTGLYELATARYLENAQEWLFRPMLEGSDDGFADVLDFLTRLKTGLTAPDVQPGCLIINDMAAGPDKGPSARYQRLLESGLGAAFGRTNAPKKTVDQRTAIVASAVIGINLMSRAGRTRAELAHMIDSVTQQVRSWAS